MTTKVEQFHLVEYCRKIACGNRYSIDKALDEGQTFKANTFGYECKSCKIFQLHNYIDLNGFVIVRRVEGDRDKSGL